MSNSRASQSAEPRADTATLHARVAELEGQLATERRRADHLVILNEVSRRIGAILNQEDLLEQVVTLIRERLGYDRVEVLLVDGAAVVVRATAGWTSPSDALGARFTIGEQGIVGLVAHTAQPMLVNEVEREPRFILQPAGGETRAELAVPIRLGERVLGVLDVQSARANAFAPYDVATLEILADQIAVALENARVYRALNQHLAEVVALQEVGTALIAERDTQRVMETLADQARQLFGAELVSLQLLVPNQPWLEIAVASGLYRDQVLGVRVPLENSLAGLVIRDGQVRISHDARNDPRMDQSMVQRAQVRNVLMAPLLRRDQPVGTISATNKLSGAFTERDTELMKLFGGYAAVALENARVYRAMEQHLAEIVALQEIATVLMAERDVRRVMETVVEQARLLLEAETVSLELLVPGRPRREVDVASGRAADQLTGTRVPVDASLSGVVVREGRVHLSADAGQDPRTDKETVRLGSVRSLLVAPMGHGGRPVGTISAYNKRSGAFTERDAELMALFGAQAAVAIENTRLLDSERRRARQAEALAAASITINSSLDLTRTLDAISRQVAETLEAQRAAIFLHDPDDDVVYAGAAAGLAPALRDVVYALRATRQALKSFRDTWNGVTVAVDDTFVEPEINANIRQIMGVRSFMATPLRVKGEYLGFLYVDQSDEPRHWTEDDRRLFEALAAPVATAVANARLHGQAQQLAAVEERTRLARELHDSVTQSLFSASLIAQAAQSLWKRDPERAKERLDRTAELCAGALAEMRALIFELRPAALQEEGLVSALRKHAAARQARDGVVVDVAVQEERRLPPNCEEAAYRIVREALHNVVKHARATHVAVQLDFQPGRLMIEIRDNGQGFDAAAAAGRGLGLTSMRERAEGLGGILAIESTVGVGTTIRAEIREACD